MTILSFDGLPENSIVSQFGSVHRPRYRLDAVDAGFPVIDFQNVEFVSRSVADERVLA